MDKKNIKDIRYYLDDQTRLNTRKHNEAMDWLSVYYFEDRHNRRYIKYNKYFRKNSLYFISERSKNDKIFNYYKIVKPKYSGVDEIGLPAKNKNTVSIPDVPIKQKKSHVVYFD